MTSMPLSVLENICKNVNKESQESNIEKVKENLKKIKETLSDRRPEKENQVQTKCEVEKVSPQDPCQAKRDGSDNQQEITEGSEPSPQKSKGRRVRKSN